MSYSTGDSHISSQGKYPRCRLLKALTLSIMTSLPITVGGPFDNKAQASIALIAQSNTPRLSSTPQ